jgi:hypothetical protein
MEKAADLGPMKRMGRAERAGVPMEIEEAGDSGMQRQ